MGLLDGLVGKDPDSGKCALACWIQLIGAVVGIDKIVTHHTGVGEVGQLFVEVGNEGPKCVCVGGCVVREGVDCRWKRGVCAHRDAEDDRESGTAALHEYR